MRFEVQFGAAESGIPLAEYPRPQFKRTSYFSLNGEWKYEILRAQRDYDDSREEGKILVPYSPECDLSGVKKQLKSNESLALTKKFTLPEGFNQGRVLLNVGACDQVCAVFVNGKRVGTHKGGYLPFTLEIGEKLKEGENELYFFITDDANSDVYGRGKQAYDRGGIWYTATSGIWQSIWLESVPNDYVKSVKLTPDYPSRKLAVALDLTNPEKPATVRVKDGDQVIAEGVCKDGRVTLDVSDCKDWTVDEPELYPLEIEYGEDRVESYFGLRGFSVVERKGKKFFALNGKPVFHNGLLDQGYYHDGLYTPGDNRTMYEDIAFVKRAGFNMIRKHIKVEPMLWYYYCDVLGVLVWQDMINGGAKYPAWRIMLAPFLNLHLDDSDYEKMGRSERSREWYYEEAFGLVDTLYNVVSLCLWTPFNEAWGQFDALKTWQMLKEKDSTRQYDHASGWQDMGGGDVCSKHIYFRKARIKNDRKRVLALTEFGGYSFAMDGHIFSDKAFGYKRFKSQQSLVKAYEELYLQEVIPLIKKQGLGATVYTQLTDVEDEINGILTFDRIEKFPIEKLQEINERVYRVFDETVKE